MRKAKALSILFVVVLPTVAIVVNAQESKKVPRIGLLTASSPSTMAPRVDAFRQGLHDLGYVEGKNVVIEYRYAEGKRERWPNLASEMVRLKPDVIVVGGTGPTRSVKEAPARSRSLWGALAI